MVVELVVPDFHGNMKIFKSLEKILANHKVDRVFFVGDFSDGIDKSKLPGIATKILENPKVMEFAKKNKEALMRLQQKASAGGRLSKQEQQEYMEAMYGEQAVARAVFSEEARLRYEPIDKAVSDISQMYKTHFYGVPGNHDNVLCLQHLKALRPMLYLPKQGSLEQQMEAQPLLKEKVLGLVHINPEGGEVHPDWAGPPNPDEQGHMRCSYAFPGDDADDLDTSPVWQNFKNTPLDLVVTHKSAMYGTTSTKDFAPYGKGLKQLAKVNEGLVEYAGHFHGDDIDGKGWVYRDRNTKALSICPGTSYCMIVNRDGKNVKSATPIALGYATDQ